jgi:hypothetical protein
VLSASFLVISNLYTRFNSSTSAASESSIRHPGSRHPKTYIVTRVNETGRTEKSCVGLDAFHPGDRSNR